MVKVTFFLPDGSKVSGTFALGTTLLAAARSLKVPVLSTCDGEPNCTDCRMRIEEGLAALSPPMFDEIGLMGSVSHITRERLSCQARMQGDVVARPLRWQRHKP